MLLGKIWRWFGRNPLLVAALIAGAGAGIGFGVAYLLSGKLQENLQAAAIALLFVGFAGPAIKLLLDDFQKSREKRSEQAQFLTNVLADLKAVYDRVERARILIPAHQSALTYGKEMRALIPSRVRLRNVIRALHRGTSGIPPDKLEDLKRAVRLMEVYLGLLTDEFQLNYKRIADKQKAHEANVEHALAQLKQGGAEDKRPENEAWKDITELAGMKGFIGERLADPATSGPAETLEYTQRFEEPLDLASWFLGDELRALSGEKRGALPRERAATKDRLPSELAKLKGKQ
jgi:hypothetical protein